MSSPGKGAKRVGLLLSGGVDSSTLLLDLLRHGREVHPLYVRSGFFWEKAERHWLGKLLAEVARPRLRPLTVLDLPAGPWLAPGHWVFTGKGAPGYADWEKDLYLPGRNLLLLSAAGVLCAQRGLSAVALAILAGNPYPDASPRFLALMGGALSAGLKSPVKILAPYRALTKRHVARRARSLGLPLRLTFSCVAPRGVRPCGRCCKCGELSEMEP